LGGQLGEQVRRAGGGEDLAAPRRGGDGQRPANALRGAGDQEARPLDAATVAHDGAPPEERGRRCSAQLYHTPARRFGGAGGGGGGTGAAYAGGAGRAECERAGELLIPCPRCFGYPAGCFTSWPAPAGRRGRSPPGRAS